MTVSTTTNLYKKNAIIVGVLFIIATVFLFIGEAIYGPYLSNDNYLVLAYPNRIAATLGMLLEFACVISIPLIPVFLYPVLRKHSQTMALAYIIFRFFEAILFILEEINELALINVSQQYLTSGNAGEAAYFVNYGMSLQSWNGWLFSFYLLVFGIGGLFFYTALYQSKITPRFISIWGLIAAASILFSVILILLEINLGLDQMTFQLIFVAPIAIQEMVMAVWFIVKGFNTSSLKNTEGISN